VWLSKGTPPPGQCREANAGWTGAGAKSRIESQQDPLNFVTAIYEAMSKPEISAAATHNTTKGRHIVLLPSVSTSVASIEWALKKRYEFMIEPIKGIIMRLKKYQEDVENEDVPWDLERVEVYCSQCVK
jgi:hypothetical protein